MGVIYLITCKTSGHQYVGQTKFTSRTRWIAHCSEARSGRAGCSALNAAIRKYGEEDFDVRDVYEVDDDELDMWEEATIEEYKTFGNGGYNLTSGGGAFRQCSDETRRKISEAHTGLLKGVEKPHKAPRKRPEDNVLPKYIIRYSYNGQEGYKVNGHMSMGKREALYFTRSDQTMEQRLEAAKAALAQIEAGTLDRTQRNGIPKYIQKFGVGYRVVAPGHKMRSFCSTAITVEERLALAIAYLNTLQIN